MDSQRTRSGVEFPIYHRATCVCQSLHTVSESNLGSLRVIVGALVSPNIDERLEDVEGDP